MRMRSCCGIGEVEMIVDVDDDDDDDDDENVAKPQAALTGRQAQ